MIWRLRQIIHVTELTCQLVEMAVLAERCEMAVLTDEESTITWLKRRGLLKDHLDCTKCSTACRFIPRKESFAWRCPRKGCQAVHSFREGSFYAGSHLKVDDILAVTYWWATGQPVGNAMRETGHSSNTIVDWYNFHRDVCMQYFIDHPVQIGGPGKVVEIDESKFGKRKFNRGRRVDGHWVFGGIERGSSEAFMVEVSDRSAATLLPLIQRHVLPGTTVLSDQWRAYSQISTSLGMPHQTVNHSLHFVDPATGIHTQGIESTWSQVKRMMRREGVMATSPELFQSYLSEFLWRRKTSDRDPFDTILNTIKEQYPL